ncbi:MAG: DUF2079 domain-containing protein [Nitrospirota bacterium]
MEQSRTLLATPPISIRLVLAIVGFVAAGWLAARLVVPVVLRDSPLVGLARLYAEGMVLTMGIALVSAVGVMYMPRVLVGILDRFAVRAFVGLSLAYAGAMGSMAWLKVSSLHSYADMATHLEVFWRATQGLGFTTPMSESYHHGAHWFAAHLTPIIYLIYPLFQLAPSVTTLLVLQTIALAGAAIPIGLYARDRLGARSGMWIGVAFLLYPTLQYTNLYEFEYLRFSIPCLAWAFYAAHRRWWVGYSVSVALALLVREEVGLVIFMLGCYLLFFKRERWIGGLTAVAGLGYFVLAIGVIIPAFRDGGGLVYASNYASLGGSVSEILTNLFVHPIVVLKSFLSQTKVGNFVMFFLPVQFLAFLSPSILLIALPNFASTFLSDALPNYSFLLYYLSPSVPFIFFAAIEGAVKVKRVLAQRWGDRLGQEHAALVVSLYLVVGVLSSNIFFGPSPVSRQFWDATYKVGEFYTTNFFRSAYQVTPHVEAAKAIVALVPRDAVVSAEQQFLPYLYDRKRMYVFPSLAPDVDHVLIDRTDHPRTGWADTYMDFRLRPEVYYAQIESDPGTWVLVAERDGVSLYRRLVSPGTVGAHG